MFYPRGIRVGNLAKLRGKFRCQRYADGNAFAMEQPLGEAGRGFQRVTKGVAEIEQRPLAGLALVARDDRGLGAAGGGNGVLARGAAGENLAVVLLQPSEEGGIAKQAVFG